MTWQPPDPRASIVTFKNARGRWCVGVWVRGGTEAELAEFITSSTFFQPLSAGS